MTFHIIYQIQHCRFCITIRCFLPLLFLKYAFLCIHGFYHTFQHFHNWRNKEKRKHFFFFFLYLPFHNQPIASIVAHSLLCQLYPTPFTLHPILFPDIYIRLVILSSLKIDYFIHQTFSCSIFYFLLQSHSDYDMFFTKCACMIQP